MSVRIPGRERFIGRQAILDKNMELYGYELLFRSGTENNTFSGDVEDATNQIIDSCLSMIACSSCKNLFVNCTRDALINMSVMLLPSRTVVLEILETVVVDVEIVKACRMLKDAGFRLALDDFSPHEHKGELLEMADYVKIDFRASNPVERQIIYKLFPRKPVFLAEKVETLDEVEAARSEGNSLFQGYFHARPEIIAETQIAPTKAIYLQLFTALAVTPMDTQRVERLLLMEPSLCYRLLRLANSAAYGLRFRAATIQAALNIVGEDAFRKLVTVVVAGNLSHRSVDRNAEQALERAFFCESLAPLLQENPAELYMLGMLSMMDQMLNVPMKKLVELISVDARIQGALLGSGEGIGRALVLCRYEERGGDSRGLPHPDKMIPNSSTYYFRALLAAGKMLQGL